MSRFKKRGDYLNPKFEKNLVSTTKKKEYDLFYDYPFTLMQNKDSENNQTGLSDQAQLYNDTKRVLCDDYKDFFSLTENELRIACDRLIENLINDNTHERNNVK